MARPPSSNPKSVYVGIRVSELEAKALDNQRKGLSRAAYIRWLIQHAVEGARPSSLSEPDPPEPVDTETFVPPVDTPITPTSITPAVSPSLPYPPPPAAATSRSPRHLHKYKTGTEPSRYVQGRPVYPKVCECGAMKEGTR